MKSILTTLLFCLLLESILSTKITLKMKKDNPTKAIKDIKGKNLRKLEETESIAVIDYPSNTVEEFSTYLDVQTSQPDGQSSSKKDHQYHQIMDIFHHMQRIIMITLFRINQKI